MVEIIAIGLIAWVLTGAVEDNIRSARGDQPRTDRRGLRGYLDDRWAALADTHHRNRSLLNADGTPGWWTRKRIMGRRRALAHAGYRTDEDIAKAAAEHRRRMALIAQGIDPDEVPEVPTVDPPRDEHGRFTTEPKDQPVPERGEGQGPAYTSAEVWINPEYDQSWSPFDQDTTETDSKEATVATGEITGPADVGQFHADTTAAMDGISSIADTLEGTQAQLEQRATECEANMATIENAAAGMRSLGMDDAADAAGRLVEIQQGIAATMRSLAQALKDGTGQLIDQVEASRAPLAAIKTAHEAQVLVQDTRAGVGRGNLAADSYSDNG